MGSSGWFRVQEMVPGIFVIQEPGHVQSYLVQGKERSALIDTGMGFCDIREAAEPLAGNSILVLNTHWHFDHIGGNALFTQIAVSILEAKLIEKPIPNDLLRRIYVEPFMEQGVPFPQGFDPRTYKIRGSRATRLLDHGEEIDLGGRILRVLATPGHTWGSLSFLDSRTGALLCGDFLYPGTLYAHFEDSDPQAYIRSLKRILEVEGEVRLMLGGHNEPLVPKDLPKKALEGFQRILEGARPTYTVYDWGEPVLRYEFGEVHILTKPPGSRGVKLPLA
jgi:glyoxylase-like metal-dependent hydrolase (beta-lactamase superfamily II)